STRCRCGSSCYHERTRAPRTPVHSTFATSATSTRARRARDVMMRTLTSAAAVLALSAVMAPPAQAQVKWTDKGFANVSFGVQAPSHTLDTNNSFDIYGESASQISSQDVGGGAFFDISGGYKVWKNLAVGIGLTFVGSKSDLVVNAQIPDPNFFDRLRPVTT